MRAKVGSGEAVKCAGCGRSVLKTVAVKSSGKVYCCRDCAEGKTCDCQ